MIPNELAWAAGMFEGDGTVRINTATKGNLGHLVVSVVNTDRDVLDWFQARWPGSMKSATGLDPTRQKPAWVWVIAARKAAVFLMEIRPYVVRRIVAEKIALALEFQEQKRSFGRGRPATDEYREAQWAYWMRMGDLNVRGSADKWRRR